MAFQKGHKGYKFWLGKKFSQEHRQKISQDKKGSIPWNKGKKCPKISEILKGRKLSIKHRKAISEGKKGMKLSEKHRNNISVGNIRRWNRTGRKIYKRYKHLTATKEYKKWRMAVFIRDDFTCQSCRNVGRYLEAHHIKSWSKYPKLRHKVENGVTLCSECHKLTY